MSKGSHSDVETKMRVATKTCISKQKFNSVGNV